MTKYKQLGLFEEGTKNVEIANIGCDYNSEQYVLPEARIFLKEMELPYGTKHITTVKEAIGFVRGLLKPLDREQLILVNFDTRLKPLNYNVVSIGGTTQAIVDIKNIMKAAILSNAEGIMLFHNHPSGEAYPSEEDLKSTEKVKKACKIMGIRLLDHIIAGSDSAYSIETKDRVKL